MRLNVEHPNQAFRTSLYVNDNLIRIYQSAHPSTRRRSMSPDVYKVVIANDIRHLVSRMYSEHSSEPDFIFNSQTFNNYFTSIILDLISHIHYKTSFLDEVSSTDSDF